MTSSTNITLLEKEKIFFLFGRPGKDVFVAVQKVNGKIQKICQHFKNDGKNKKHYDLIKYKKISFLIEGKLTPIQARELLVMTHNIELSEQIKFTFHGKNVTLSSK